jgi:glycosyltransferase involved in cell wall biosynthesis
MAKIKLSILMACYKEIYLEKVILDIFHQSRLGDALEVICVFDGEWPDQKTLIQDPRLRYVFLGANRGMRGAYNAGIAVARGEFFMRLDSHCIFGDGFDQILTDDCKENEVMTAKRYFLNPVEWKVMLDKGFVGAEKLVIQNVSEGVRKFAGKRWDEKVKEMEGTPIFEVSAQQGSCWIANRKFWLKTCGELQTEGYGPLIQDSVEVSMKYWQAGGRLMMNHNTWYAHKDRSFPRTHNNGTKENPSNDSTGYAYSLKQWESYYNEVIKPRFGI